MSTAVAAPKKNELKTLISGEQFKNQLAMVTAKHVTPERIVRVALTAMIRTPKLAECDQASFCLAILNCASYGLEPNGRQAHLIPFENRKRGIVECQLIVDYKGLAELAMRSGAISYIHADVVCDSDKFDCDVGQLRQHKIDYRNPRGKVYAAYCIVRFKDGSEKCEVMTVEEIEAIRKRSRSGTSGPWVTDWNEMAKKTVFRRLSKWLPLSPEIHDAAAHDDDIIEGEMAEKPKAKTLSDLAATLSLPEPQQESDDLPAIEGEIEPTTDSPKKPPVKFATCMAKLRGAKTLAEIEEAEDWVRNGDNSDWQPGDDPQFWSFAEQRKNDLGAAK